MLKFRLDLLLIFCLLPFLGISQMTFEAKLTGRSEATPIATNAFGEIIASLDGNELSVNGYFAGLEGAYDATIAGGAHLHIGMAGENGPIAIMLMPTLDVELQSGTFDAALNTYTLTNDQVDALMERGMYVNIHSTIYPGGELRGQLLPEADEYYHINMFGNNEVPSIITGAFGALSMELRGDELIVSGSFSGLEGDFDANIAGGAHLHMELPGSNGDVAILLNASTSADLRSGTFESADNTFTLDATQLEALQNRMLYSNIHTTAYAGGELRGQVASSEAKVAFRAHLSGTNEMPIVASLARGQVQAELIGDSLYVVGSFDGLGSGIATDIAGGAHLHTAKAGSNGEVAYPLTFSTDNDNNGGSFEFSDNQYELTSDEIEMLMDRGFYVNIHTMDEMPGELRGQLLPESQAVFTAFLSGSFETSAVTTTAFGAVKAELSGNTLIVSGTFNDLSSALDVNIVGGAHLHLGVAGENGDVIFPLDSETDMLQTSGTFSAGTNRFELSDTEVEALMDRGIYVNIHSLNFSAGELRGQLLREAQIYMSALLSASSEVPPVNSESSGLLMLEITRDSVYTSGAFSGLASEFDPNVAGGAHLHNALAGSNGDVVISLQAETAGDNLSGTFPVSDNTFGVAEMELELLRTRAMYANIHTVDNQAGELRGQVLPAATAYLTATLDPFNEVPPISTAAQGALKFELNGSELTLSGSFSDLQSEFDASVAGGAHLHLAGPGANGGVDILINADVDGSGTSGTFNAAENTFLLDGEQVQNLLGGDYYVNIHTMDFAAGELRGQSLPERNFFPEADASIIFPPDALDVTLEGPANDIFAVTWTAATDENELAYVWQASLDADFEDIVFQENVGNELSFTATLGEIDDLIESLGVTIGSEVTVYHRVVASDGSLYTAGASSTINVTRGDVMEENYVASLSGHNEVLPIGTTASGSVTASLVGNELTVSGSFENLSSPVATDIVGGAHLHLGFAGQNGDVAYPLNLQLSADMTSGEFVADENVFDLSNEEVTALRNRQIYVNIHSENFRGGELRAQLLPEANEVYTLSLLGSNEVPSIISRGFGALALEIEGDSLVVSGAFSGLEGMFDENIAGGAHLHLGLAGQNGDITILLNATLTADMQSGVFQPEDNRFGLSTEQLDALEARNIYANIHTTLYGGGELRGQAVSGAQAVFRAHLSGSNEIPVVTTLANGEVIAELSNDSVLTVSGSFSGLESDLATDIGAHIHMALPGANGDVIFPLAFSLNADNRSGRFEAADNQYDLSGEQVEALMSRELYVNIHTTDNNPGEIRGQLMLESQTVMTGFASGIQTIPQVATSALGGLQAEVSGNRFTVVGSFAGLSSPVATEIAGGAHIHTAIAGSTGDVLFPLNLDLEGDNLSGSFNAASNTFLLEEPEKDMLLDRGFYFNLHTENFNPGELRAQLLPEANTYFVVPLSGASEVPAANTSAGGAAIIEINSLTATATGSFNGLSSDLATDIAGGVHIHNGYAGANGPVAILLNTTPGANATEGTFAAADNSFGVSQGQIDTMRMRGNYVNIHSLDFESGELRGQVLPYATTYFTSSFDGWNEVQPIMTEATGGAKLELTGMQLVVSGAFSGLESMFDENVAGGAHLHIAGPGENGDVDIALTSDLDNDMLGGRFLVSENTYDLTEEQAMMLRQGNYYFNIHTVDNQAGELRGQALVEVNSFPSDEADIASPADGTELTIAGDPATPFSATWEAADDRDELAYIWQLSTDEDFTMLLVNQNVGSAQAFNADFGTVDMLLEQAGVELNETVTLYHRALASDGSVYTPGESASVILTRGIVSSNADLQPEAFGMQVYPTLTNSELNVELESSQSYQGNLLITNANGQLIRLLPIGLNQGTILERIDVQSFPAGKYYIQLAVEGQRLETKAFIKQ
jgi:hypothetical protein